MNQPLRCDTSDIFQHEQGRSSVEADEGSQGRTSQRASADHSLRATSEDRLIKTKVNGGTSEQERKKLSIMGKVKHGIRDKDMYRQRLHEPRDNGRGHDAEQDRARGRNSDRDRRDKERERDERENTKERDYRRKERSRDTVHAKKIRHNAISLERVTGSSKWRERVIVIRIIVGKMFEKNLVGTILCIML